MGRRLLTLLRETRVPAAVAVLATPLLAAFALTSGGSSAQAARPRDGSGPTPKVERADSAIQLRGTVAGRRIGPLSVDGTYRAIETDKAARVSQLVIDGVSARVTRECYRVRGSNILIRNMHCRMIGGPQQSPHLPEGLHIESGDSIRVEQSDFSGFQMVMPPDRYWNGDGIAAELPVKGLEIVGVTANDNTDAGFDIKPPVTMDRVSAARNCRNFRLWSDSDIGTMTIGDMVRRGGNASCAGLWIKGSGPRMPKIRIKRLVVRMSRPGAIIRVEDGPADLTIGSCDIQAPAGSTFLVMPNPQGRKALGPGCRL